jgi:broad specificity phosphatase PhoE
MRIGLIRHFKVDLKRSRFMTSKQFNEYMAQYDKADVIGNELVIDREWDKCYCSSMSRAITTAKTVYHGEIILSDKLMEIPSVAFVNMKFYLPYFLWGLLNRFAWSFHLVSQPETRKITLKRVNEIVDTILKEESGNILIVSHAGALHEIRKILLQKGFRGERFLGARNGRLYIYKNEEIT